MPDRPNGSLLLDRAQALELGLDPGDLHRIRLEREDHSRLGCRLRDAQRVGVRLWTVDVLDAIDERRSLVPEDRGNLGPYVVAVEPGTREHEALLGPRDPDVHQATLLLVAQLLEAG